MKGFSAPAICVVLGISALAGCTSWWPAPAAPAVQETHLVCDSKAEVFWHYTDTAHGKVDARLLGSDQVYHLKAEVGADGQLFSDGVLALHIKDDQGLVYWVATNDLIGRGCKAP